VRDFRGESLLSIHGKMLLVAVARLSITQTRAAALAARSAGMNPSAYAILSELALDGWLTNGQISERLAMSTGGVTPALDRLERGGYLERNPNPADRRSSVVSITARGQDLLRRTTARLDEALGPVLAGFAQRDREAVLRFLIGANDAYTSLYDEQLNGDEAA
jgi:DNA-binding MarR family transcriptional regulator